MFAHGRITVFLIHFSIQLTFGFCKWDSWVNTGAHLLVFWFSVKTELIVCDAIDCCLWNYLQYTANWRLM